MSTLSRKPLRRNRLVERFRALRAERRKAFIAFVMAGDPEPHVTERLIAKLGRLGVDLVELGVPFSDPIADGPTIQRSSQRALKWKVTLKQVFSLIKIVRHHTQVPIVIMSYANPIWRLGVKQAVRLARDAGCDGFIIPDLIPEEAGELVAAARAANLCTIFFVAPTSTEERIRLAARASTGFLYYVSVTGVTGERETLPAALQGHVRRIKRITSLPVCVGFGIATPEQAKRVARWADGVIVGSAIARRIEEDPNPYGAVKNILHFVKPFVDAVKGLPRRRARA